MLSGTLDTIALSTSIDSRRERKRLASQAWRAANREHHRAYNKKYREEHPDHTAAKKKEWRDGNWERMLELQRRSRELRPEIYKEHHQRYHAKNPGLRAFWCKTRRARRKGAEGNITRAEWEAIKRLFGGRCAKCGSLERISMDHVVPLSCGGSHSAENIQPLCVSCNSAKHVATADYRATSPYRCA